MMVERKANNVLGPYYEITDIVNGYLFRRIYEGYTRKEAIALYREERKEERNKRS